MAISQLNPIKQPQQPVIDSQHAMSSLATMLGPTPAEREAMERRALKNKTKMQAWAGLFDGLRQLGNLYAVSKGAKPQQYTDNPYQQIEANYQADRQREMQLEDYQRQYAQQLYNIQKQASDEMRRDALTEAQVKHYGNMDEVARQKAEIDKLKAARVIKMKDGSLQKYDPVTGTVEELIEGDPLYTEYMRSQINRNNRTGKANGRVFKDGSYMKKRWIDENGITWEQRVDGNGNELGTPFKVRENKKGNTGATTKPNASGHANSGGKKGNIDYSKLSGFSIH